MLHKKRRRTRKITVLQKKEELLESSDLLYYDDGDTLVETNSTEINNNNSCSSYHSQLANSTGISETTMMSVEQEAWRRRWKRPRGHSLWRNISPWRKSINLFTFGLLLISIFSYKVEVQGQPPPLPPAGFLDFDNLPVTRFSCEGKVIGGYYADVETGCQMFHVCTLGQKDEVQDIKFLCLNGTVFDQETRVCERVDEVDCSKAEQFFDLNLDLYVPHVATPKPPEQDLEEEDANIRPVSTSKPTSPPPTTTTPRPTTTTKRPTTTATPRSVPTTTSTSSRTRLTTPQSPEATTTKGYSSFNYYLKTPHSHVSSGYNSQSRQSYIFNHKPNLEDEPEDNSGSYTVSENTARKIPSGPKTIVYTPSTSSTSRPSNRGAASYTRNSISSTTTPAPAKLEELDEQYADEYYEDEDYDVSSSTAGSQQPNSKQSSSSSSYEIEPRSKNSYSAQPQTQFRGKSSQSSYDFRDGRSTGPSKSSSSSSSSSSRGSKGGSESSVSVAVSRSKATISPPVITRPPSRSKVTNVTTTTTTEEPYYYDDDYPEDEIAQQHQQPAIIVRGTSSSTSRSASGASSDPSRADSSSRSIKASSNSKSTAVIDTSDPSGPSGPTGSDADHSEYYDDGGDGQSLNVNDHHFTHVDVPRIPFAKPNVPRVLVTNGKPFLPRLRRQSIHHSVLSHQEQKDTVPMVDISSLWESLATQDDTDDHHSHKQSPNIPLNSQSSSSRRRRNISHSLSKSKLNLEVNRASSSVILSKSKPNQISGVTKR